MIDIELCVFPTGGLPRGGKIRLNETGGGFNDYAGHVFWDMDTWVMPPILMLHPQMANLMIGARTRVLDVAKNNARETGFIGARFPWEEAVTGRRSMSAELRIHVYALPYKIPTYAHTKESARFAYFVH